MAEAEFGGLHHLALVSSDMERTVDFYTTLQAGLPSVDLPVNAKGIKANGEPITGA